MKQQEKTLLCVKSNGSSIYISGDTTNEEEMVALFKAITGVLCCVTRHDYTVADLYTAKTQVLPTFFTALAYQLDERMAELGITTTDGMSTIEEIITTHKIAMKMEEEEYNNILKNAPKPSDEKKNYN